MVSLRVQWDFVVCECERTEQRGFVYLDTMVAPPLFFVVVFLDRGD